MTNKPRKERVLNLDHFIEIIKDDFRSCSICGEYKPVEEFNCDGKKSPATRTNCVSCYKTPSELWPEIEKKAHERRKNPTQEALKEIGMSRVKEIGMPVSELIKMLKKLPKDAYVTMTQGGYYSEGLFADIHAPDLVIKDAILGSKYSTKLEEDIPLYSIGHSEQ